MTRKTTEKLLQFRAFLARGGLCVLMSVFLSLGNPAQAQPQAMPSPFALGEKWVDINQFEAQANEAETPQTPAVTITEGDGAVAFIQKGVTAKAAPERPLNLPALPTMTNDHGFFVESTEEAKAIFWSAVQEHNWKSTETADQELEAEVEAAQLVNILGRDPFKVRYALLPSPSLRSTMASRIATSILDREAQVRKAEKEAAAKPVLAQKKVDPAVQKETNQACEAFADYRRRQLEAMESDRKTLAALQAALADMGLSKDLSFMTKASSVLTAQQQEATTQKSATPATPSP